MINNEDAVVTVVGLGLGALAFINPVLAGGLALSGALTYGPHIYSHKKACERDEKVMMQNEINKAQKEWEETHTLRDPRTGVKWKLEKPLTTEQKVEYSRRIIKEPFIDIISDMKIRVR